MNTKLRKSTNVREMLRRKYDKFPNRHTWEAYRRQRNMVTSLRKQSKSSYMKKTCKEANSTEFWKTVKQLISRKNRGSET